MKSLLHKMKEKRNLVDILCIFMVAVILALPMFNSKTDIYLDDGSQHLLRAYGTYKDILQNSAGAVISDFANGFGYSWNLFYGSLSTYFLILTSVIVGSFNVGFKIAMCLLIFFAGTAMYKFVQDWLEDENTALLAGIIYITAPYFFTDIYVRHAVGEAMTFVFIPMVFWRII